MESTWTPSYHLTADRATGTIHSAPTILIPRGVKEKQGMALALTTMKLYNPADSNSSPYDPAMGDIVLYRTQRSGHQAPEQFPAIVVKAHADDRCDLSVFTTYGVQHIMRVRFSSDDLTENTWGWLPEKDEHRTIREDTVAASVAHDREIFNKTSIAQNLPIGTTSLPRGSETPVDKAAVPVHTV